MDRISNLLASLFSVHVGRTDQPEALGRIRQNPNPAERENLRADFGKALADPDFDWLARFDEEEVNALIETNAEARAFVVEQIWIPLFGPDPDPGASPSSAA